MKKLCLNLAMGALAVTLSLATSLSAQVSPQFLAAGSSAMFNSFAYAAANPTSGICGGHHWSKKNGASIDDTARNSNIPLEAGNIWIAWDNSTNPTTVCAYVSVDSSVGVRAFMANPVAVVDLASSYVGTFGDSLVGTLSSEAATDALPLAIQQSINKQSVLQAMTDVRPEDAKFATERALATLNARLPYTSGVYYGLGYNQGAATGVGTPIYSSQSATKATPVEFNLFGNDPFTGGATPAWHTDNVGAAPVVVFANVTDNASGSGGLGDPTLAITNVDRYTLAGLLSGRISRTRDLSTASGASSVGVNVFIREPLSGTMNTMEYNVTNSVGVYANVPQAPWGPALYSGQETNVGNPSCPCPTFGTSNAANPLQLPTAAGMRYRVVGTGEMVKTVAKTADALGYAFWGYGNFSASNNNAPTTTHYLTVDGTDPLFANGTNPNGVGVFPTPTSGVYPSLTFPNIQNGSYPVWTMYRVVYTNATRSFTKQIIAAAQANANRMMSDFIPASSVNVFHTHFYQEQFGGMNGNLGTLNGGCPVTTGDCESGGDAGGQVFNNQAALDNYTDTGYELVGMRK